MLFWFLRKCEMRKVLKSLNKFKLQMTIISYFIISFYFINPDYIIAITRDDRNQLGTVIIRIWHVCA